MMMMLLLPVKMGTDILLLMLLLPMKMSSSLLLLLMLLLSMKMTSNMQSIKGNGANAGVISAQEDDNYDFVNGATDDGIPPYEDENRCLVGMLQ